MVASKTDMSRSNESIKRLFFQGNYRDLLRDSIDSSYFDAGQDIFALPWIIGALCFNGRQEEARLLLKSELKSLDEENLAACHFFLGIAFCRHGHYGTAREFLAKNLFALRRKQGENRWISFYALQGLAFYRYVCARFPEAKSMAEAALSHAKSLRYEYGIILALDLVAHAETQIGNLSSGLSRFQEARERAEKLGHGGLAKSIQLSTLSYRAQFGLSPKSILKELRSARKYIDPQNSHALANLLLETANQYILRGQLDLANTTLNDASTLIYKSQHRRYTHLLALRFAELGYRRGNFANSLQAVRMLRPLLDSRYDRLNLLMCLGLELKLLRSLSMTDHIPQLLSELELLTKKTRRAISQNIFARSDAGEDRIGKVLQECAVEKKSALPLLIESGYLGLVYEAFEIMPGQRCLVCDLEDGSLLILDQGEIIHSKTKLTPLVKQLLYLLHDKALSKADLIEQLWRYRYRPLHHDPLIYQAVARLREILGTQGHWVEMSEAGYRLRQGVTLLSAIDQLKFKIPQEKTRNSDSSASPLNPRQIQLLRLFKQREFIGIRDCLKAFKVSDMTLKRDLAHLLAAGFILKHGQARATRYRLRQSNEY